MGSPRTAPALLTGSVSVWANLQNMTLVHGNVLLVFTAQGGGDPEDGARVGFYKAGLQSQACMMMKKMKMGTLPSSSSK